VPVFKDVLFNMGWLFIPFAMIVIVGAANAVNLTDGLDGLAIMPVMIAAGTLGVIAYAVGRVDFTEYLDVHYVPGTGELLVFRRGSDRRGLGLLVVQRAACRRVHGRYGIAGAGRRAGRHRGVDQARDRVGHRGRALRGRGVSVIVQVGYFKATGKRVFLMAPIHHHFEKKGWAEPQVVIRFWIISLILALIGLATLKLR
jgi:phospho-N-acetylmuramoyl-pentapeptide-transferase